MGCDLIYNFERRRDLGFVGLHRSAPYRAAEARQGAAARSAPMSRLEALGVAKRYRCARSSRTSVVSIESGQVVGLLGPNGAGKTTAFYMIVGRSAATEGSIWLNGRDITRLPVHRRARLGLGYLPQEASVFRKLSVADNIRAILETRKDSTAWRGRRNSRSSWKNFTSAMSGIPSASAFPAATAARRDRAGARGGAEIRAAGRAFCGRRPDFRARHPAHYPPPGPRDIGSDHRP